MRIYAYITLTILFLITISGVKATINPSPVQIVFSRYSAATPDLNPSHIYYYDQGDINETVIASTTYGKIFYEISPDFTKILWTSSFVTNCAGGGGGASCEDWISQNILSPHSPVDSGDHYDGETDRSSTNVTLVSVMRYLNSKVYIKTYTPLLIESTDAFSVLNTGLTNWNQSSRFDYNFTTGFGGSGLYSTDDGKYIIYGVGDFIFTSNNFGHNWTLSINPAGSIHLNQCINSIIPSASLSNDGRIQILACSIPFYTFAGGNPVNSIISTDYGATFDNMSDCFGAQFVQVSPDGSTIMCSDETSYIKESVNSGLTFNTLHTIDPSDTVNFMQANKDLSIVMLLINNTVFEKSSDGGTTFSLFFNASVPVGTFRMNASTMNSFIPNTDFQVSLFDINSKTVYDSEGNPTVYVYPIVPGSGVIQGNYVISSQSSTNYLGVVCNFTQIILMNDTFNNVVNASQAGWQGCDYETAILDTFYGFSLFLNTTGTCISTSDRLLPPNIVGHDILLSYDIRPRADINFVLDRSQNIITSLRSSSGSDITPLLISYNGSAQQSCFYSYNPSPTLLYCQFDNGQSFIHVTELVSLNTHTYSIKTDISGSPSLYSSAIPTFTNSVQIGYFRVNPVDSDSNSYFDNLLVNDIPKLPPLSLTNATNINLSTYQSQYLCDYSSIGCYDSVFFYQSTNNQVWNNFKTFHVCSAKSEANAIVPGTGQQTSNFLNNLLGVNSSSSAADLLTTAFFVMVITFFAALIFIWIFTREGLLAILISVVLSMIEFVMFAVTGYFPVWVVAVIIIIAAGIIMIIGRNILFGRSAGGG